MRLCVPVVAAICLCVPVVVGPQGAEMSAQHNPQQFVPHVHSLGDIVDADAHATGTKTCEAENI